MIIRNTLIQQGRSLLQRKSQLLIRSISYNSDGTVVAQAGDFIDHDNVASFFSPIVEKNDRQNNFDFSTGQLVEAGVDGAIK